MLQPFCSWYSAHTEMFGISTEISGIQNQNYYFSDSRKSDELWFWTVNVSIILPFFENRGIINPILHSEKLFNILFRKVCEWIEFSGTELLVSSIKLRNWK